MNPPTLGSCAIVFVTPEIEKAARYYRDVLGFRLVEHYDRPEKFAALYRDAVEILLVQSQHGAVQSNRAADGAGYDAYLVPESLAAVQAFHDEIKSRGAQIVQPPALTGYGSLEFVFEDCDGRLIGVGLIRDKELFFREKSNLPD
jgi:catechol 2,3-dioxygenase-like lactoylglutathione lyase family enzyme